MPVSNFIHVEELSEGGSIQIQVTDEGLIIDVLRSGESQPVTFGQTFEELADFVEAR